MANYMKSMKPQVNGRYKQGYYHPCNPIKYISDNKTIIYRSSLELKFCQYCDLDPTVMRWISEPDFLGIKYVNPITRKISTYFPDFYVQIKATTGIIQAIIELKASSMIEIPKGGVAKMNMYTKRQFVLNQTKKKAAETICNKNGMKYLVITEKSDFFRKSR